MRDCNTSTATVLEAMVDQVANPTREGEAPELELGTRTQQEDSVDIESLLDSMTSDLQYKRLAQVETEDTEGA